MIFDPQRRAYIDRGRVIPDSEIRQQIEEYIDEQQDEVSQEARKVLAGTLTLAAFFAFLRDRIRQWHITSGVIAFGGRSQMNLDRWKLINQKVNKELGFLDQWRIEAEKGLRATWSLASQAAALVEADRLIPSGLESVVQREVSRALLTDAASRPAAIRGAVVEALSDSVPRETAEKIAAEVTKDLIESERMRELIWGSLDSRGRMYTDATYATYQNSIKEREAGTAIGVRRVAEEDENTCDDCSLWATSEYVGLDEIQDIGTSVCGSRCRCIMEFSYLNVEPLEIAREIYA